MERNVINEYFYVILLQSYIIGNLPWNAWENGIRKINSLVGKICMWDKNNFIQQLTSNKNEINLQNWESNQMKNTQLLHWWNSFKIQ